jgi:PPOX class probable F420-dependent enzyme
MVGMSQRGRDWFRSPRKTPTITFKQKEKNMKLPESARLLIQSAAHAHLITLNPDGSPQVTLVWAGLDGDDIVTAHLYETRKVKNMRNDSRVAVTFESETKSAMGLTEYLALYGQAAIEEGGAAQLLQKLARIYMGPNVKFPSMDDPPPGFINRIKIERISGVGPWTGRVV